MKKKRRAGFKITNEMLKHLIFKDLDVEIINVVQDPNREIVKMYLIGEDLPERCSDVVEGDEFPELKLLHSKEKLALV